MAKDFIKRKIIIANIGRSVVALIFLFLTGIMAITQPIIGIIAFLISLAYSGWIVINILYPETNKANKPLLRHGNLKEVRESIKKEMVENLKFKTSRWGVTVVLTKSWFLYITILKIRIAHLDDVLFLYKSITRRKAGKRFYGINLYTPEDVYIMEIGKEERVDEVIDYFQENMPWVTLYKDDELLDLWMSDRDEVVATVNNKRNEILNN